MKGSCHWIFPHLNEANYLWWRLVLGVERPTNGYTLTLSSSQLDNVSNGFSNPSFSNPSPVDVALALAIHSNGCGAYLAQALTAKLFSSLGNISNIIFPDANAVVPRVTLNSSPEPSSYLTVCAGPCGTWIAYRAVAFDGDDSYNAESICQRKKRVAGGLPSLGCSSSIGTRVFWKLS